MDFCFSLSVAAWINQKVTFVQLFPRPGPDEPYMGACCLALPPQVLISSSNSGTLVLSSVMTFQLSPTF